MEFSQAHKIGNIDIIMNFEYRIHLQYTSSFVQYNVSKCEIRYESA